MSISSELLTLNNTKTAIKTAINNKGGNITNSTPFADYATAITNLPSGGSNADLIDLIERDITSINIPSGTTSIGDYAFYCATSLSSVTMPDSVTSIGSNAFYSCSGLTSPPIGNGVTSIGGNAFRECTGFTGNLVLPNTVTSLGQYSFKGTKFRNITIGTGITAIPNYAFQYDIYGKRTTLDSITIPNTVTSIGQYAFSVKNYNDHMEINIPDSVTTIGDCAFYDSDSISGGDYKKITIGTGITSIGSSAFSGAYSPNGSTYNKTEVLVIKATTPPTIGTGSYGQSFAFKSGYKIYVPAASVDTYKAASGWSTYASNIFAIEDAVRLTPTNGDPAISVKNYELATAGYVQSTDVPSTIKNGAGSLEVCEGVTRIGMASFRSGTSLTSVTLPSTLTRMDEVVFMDCTSLTSVTVNATTPPTMYYGAFDNTNNCPIYVPAASVDAYKAANNWSTYASRIEAIPSE